MPVITSAPKKIFGVVEDTLILSMYKGEQEYLEITIRDEDGTAMDLTNAEFSCEYGEYTTSAQINTAGDDAEFGSFAPVVPPTTSAVLNPQKSGDGSSGVVHMLIPSGLTENAMATLGEAETTVFVFWIEWRVDARHINTNVRKKRGAVIVREAK